MKHTLALAALIMPAPALAQAQPDAQLAVGNPWSLVDRTVDVDGGRAIVGAVDAAYLFERQPDGSWLEVAHIVAPVPSKAFGISVSIDGDRALVGGVSGACYVYELQLDETWGLSAVIDVPADNDAGEHFAWDVSLSGDRAAIADNAVLSGFPNVVTVGAVYVFERQPAGSWVEVARLHPDDAALLSQPFGERVDLDGDRLVTSRPADLGSPSQPATWVPAAAYVFERQPNGTWTQAAKLEPEHVVAKTYFGASVAIQGGRAVIGAARPSAGGPAGFAEVFERQPDGAWVRAARLEAPVPQPGDGFGRSVAIHGARAVVSRSASCLATGTHVFERGSAGAWTHTIALAAEGGVAFDGDHAIVCSPCPNDAWVFEIDTLYHGTPTVSASAGGTQALYLRSGVEHAGELFLLLGSLSGTSPGVALDDVVLPLVPDAYTLLLLDGAGAGLVSPFVGLLDAQGAADAAFTLPAGSNPALAGLVLHHAFVAIDVAGSGDVELASNAARLELVP